MTSYCFEFAVYLIPKKKYLPMGLGGECKRRSLLEKVWEPIELVRHQISKAHVSMQKYNFYIKSLFPQFFLMVCVIYCQQSEELSLGVKPTDIYGLSTSRHPVFLKS